MPRQNLIPCALLAAIGSSPLFASGLGAAQATAVAAATQTRNQGGVKRQAPESAAGGRANAPSGQGHLFDEWS
jgi:hypothetical protein